MSHMPAGLFDHRLARELIARWGEARGMRTGVLIAALAAILGGCVPDEPTAPPQTDIHLGEYVVSGDSVALNTPLNRTERTGYDNQPQFTRDGTALLYTSERGSSTDIYRMSLSDHTTRPVTALPTSVYSPTPRTDTTFVVVQVEDTGAQRLWEFPLSRTDPVTPDEGALLLPEVEPVGYFAWANAEQLALFVLGEPHTLQWGNVLTRRADTVRVDIGRSIESRSQDASISAVQRYENVPDSVLVAYGPDEVNAYAPALPGEGDHTWTREGHLLMTSGTSLYQWHPNAESWREVYDWNPATPSRLATSPTENRLAVVVAPPEE